MRLQDFLIGMMVVALFTLVILGFAFSTYEAMDVTIDNQTQTVFEGFERQANTTQTDLFGKAVEMQQKAPGGSDVTQGSYDQSFSDAILLSGWRVISIVPTAYNTFDGLLRVFGNALGIDPIFMYTFMASIVLIISIIFVSSILQNRL